MTVTPTSREAFKNLDEPKQAEIVTRALAQFGAAGATCEQVTDLMHDNVDFPRLHYGTVSARMTGLKEKNEIFPKKETRETKSGNPAEVFVAKEYATAEEKVPFVKTTTRKAELTDHVKSALNFLITIEAQGLLAGTWSRGLSHNMAGLEKSLELLK